MEHHWKELIAVDRYMVQSRGVLHDVDRKVLTMLYQPLIGYRALALYMTLWGELELLGGREATHHRLMALMQCGLPDIYSERLKLEGIGLLNTYVRVWETEEPKQFLYELRPPLAPDQFFRDEMLGVFLYRQVGRHLFAQLNEFFARPSIDETKFTRVTRSFSDVFSAVQAEQIVAGFSEEAGHELEPPDGKVHIGRDGASYTLDDDVFDFELFFAGLSKQLVPRRAVTAKVKEAIKKLAFLYGIPPLEMQKIVLGVIDPAYHIDIDALRQAAREWYELEHGGAAPRLVERVQPLAHRTMENVEPRTKEEQLMKQLETISPRQLLKEISGGAEPSLGDLQLIEDVMFQQQLLPGVVNVLIYYVMLRTNMKLSKKYVEKIASHWARKKVRTVKEAMELAKEEAKTYQQWANEKEKGVRPVRKVVRTEIVPDWLKMDYSQPDDDDFDVEQARKELEERLKKYRDGS
ncbi:MULTISPECIES: replication initiation and membrane attachment family protein [Geobacillus]|jgi:replication initiation and membrane attachment protein|uniref:Replication initiation and membrane attachment family protein n=1 Tax=Geobacillus thermodenitrificans TaxID=33940 RepID=A0ABY9Q9M1_GEOTD|nr:MULTISPECIES: replication initiation and membrane attachment family protein [Geobacillus]ATO38214.1 Replication initiation and membrane attachment protein [Geobacillus thermodenitrificans]KQB92287.1 Replication initiation and membrane attachment protein [Geobacillus sp. PA-3]MED3906654.1 replication initiation and membrane attachment family protein [Geobacillus thermodenitrificans]NNU85912.1 Replication initiation and membrane attachment protein [Geobacillus sp. MR]WMV75605.1 replication in